MSTPWIYRAYLSHWKQKNALHQPRVSLLHTKRLIYAWGSMSSHTLAHTFPAQLLTCIPARLHSSPTTGQLSCSMSGTGFNATTCLLHDTPQICASHNRWRSPTASCQSIPLTFLFSNVPPLALGSLPSILNAEKNCSYLIHEAWTVVELFSIPQISLWLSDSNMTFISPFSPATSQGELAI